MENENLIRRPFESKRTQEEMDKDTSIILNIRLNKYEIDLLNKSKVLLQQEKDSTALKQLAIIGFEVVLQDRKIALLLDTILNNRRRNQRLGIIETEMKFDKHLANVTQNMGVDVAQLDVTR